jgi:hypothetical protein
MSLRRLWQRLINRLKGAPQRPAVARIRRVRPLLEALEDRLVPTNWYVSSLGSDANPGTSPFAPLATIQVAVNNAGNGDNVYVAQGSYGYNAGADQLSAGLRINPAVVMIQDKTLQIYGGFNSSFTVKDPTLYHTVIEGGNVTRGVYVLGIGQDINFLMDGFTIEQGLGQAERGLDPAISGNDHIFGFGGGMWINDSARAGRGTFTLQDMVFYKNRAIGFNTNGLAPENAQETPGAGGSAAGGGLALRDVHLVMHRVTFSQNLAQGGSGDVRGGGGLGGAIQADTSQISGDNIIFANNIAQAGSSNGSGLDTAGQAASGLGGAAAFQFGAGTTLQQVTAYANQALGGNGASQGGGGQGGAFLIEGTNFSLTDASLRSNVARGGNGANGGLSGGGALDTNSANINFNRVQVLANSSLGGVGSNLAGSPTGGGIALVSVDPNQASLNQASITNSVFADNTAAFAGGGSSSIGGGGGGAWFQGVIVTLTHTTWAENVLDPKLFYGVAMLLLDDGINGFAPSPTTVTLAYSIVANHSSSSGAAAIHVRGESGRNTINYNHVLDAGNSLFDNSRGSPQDATGVGIFNGLNTVIRAASAGFVAPGAPDYNYDILPSSPAVNQAVGSTASIDIDQQSRVGVPDLGAYEAGQEPLARDTIATYDPGSGLWQVRDSNTSGFANLGMFTYGLGGNNSFPVVGHWNGKGPVTIGEVEVIRSSNPGLIDPRTGLEPFVLVWKLRSELAPGAPDASTPDQFHPEGGFEYGLQGNIPVVGDWDGNGTTTVGIYQVENGIWKLRNSNASGAPDFNTTGLGGFAFGGLPGDLPVVGDWDGNGTTTVGVVEREGTGNLLQWKLRNSNTAGGPDAANFAFGSAAQGSFAIDGIGFVYGTGNLQPVAGDWNSDGIDTVGLFDPTGKWLLKNANTPGAPDAGVFSYGQGQSRPLAGDWDGLP